MRCGGIQALLAVLVWYRAADDASLGGILVDANAIVGVPGGMSSPAYANSFEIWNCYNANRRVSASPVTFRVQCETKFEWEVCVTGGCEALGYWNPEKALLLKTDPHRYPIWEGVGQLPGGCDVEYKYLMRMKSSPKTTEWEPCPNRQLRTTCSEKAVILVTDPDNVDPHELAKQEELTAKFFKDWTTLAAPYGSTMIFNTARPQEDFDELLEDEAFQKPCALVFCRDSGTEIFVRDYEAPPQLDGMAGEALLDTRPDDREALMGAEEGGGEAPPLRGDAEHEALADGGGGGGDSGSEEGHANKGIHDLD